MDTKPCPNCGHCPTCGHVPSGVKVVPMPYPVYPWGGAPPYGPTWVSPNICITNTSATTDATWMPGRVSMATVN